ncbi:MAG: aminopeptidase [Oscillospiraceae bacterium]|nr:aminopeptidase [Oscillospiraceae bacterium]
MSLFYQQKHGLTELSDAERAEMTALCKDYCDFITKAKIEREAVAESVQLAQAAGFVPYVSGMSLKAGDRIYYNNRGKGLMLAVIGTDPIDSGAAIVAAHIDAPRIDLKQNPLYESEELCLFKTHYYGGIKKYQWPAIPLELHGVVALKDGSVVTVSVGNQADDPIFTITDLLPHLGKDQMTKTMAEGVQGEALNVLIGSQPSDAEKDAVKANILSLLNESYGIEEEDFISAELCVVPAFPARDLGFDRSMIGGYGQDDRVCAYPALRAILECTAPRRTAVCILADKEEIGSEGVTGMKSKAFDRFMEDIAVSLGGTLRALFANSFCLSADVSAAFDPTYPEVTEKRNTARLNYGVCLCKYTGSRGKSGASDASAEVVAFVRRIFDEANVKWQMCELGKVDQGGGGTVAMYMAERNIDTIDAGVPVLSMHAPFETVAKFDVYMTYRAAKAVYHS